MVHNRGMGFLLSRPKLALALQGGGAHGAFTWGVLDRLLEAGRHEVTAISGTSAGAMNAVALAHGLLERGPDGAREALQRFWDAVSTKLPFEWITVGSSESPGLAPLAHAALHWTQVLSPYQLNPLGLSPLRDILAAQIDFDRLRQASRMRLFIAATQAASGHLRLFETQELTIDAVLASACLPTLHHAVHVDGEPYWDGGYSANPALFPLARLAGTRDILMVLLSPRVHESLPVTAAEIRARGTEFAFNATFLREARMLAEACAAAKASLWPFPGPLERRLRRLRFHLVDAQPDLGALRPETRLIAHGPFLARLKELGRARAEEWLAANGRQVGRRSSTELHALLPASAGAAA